MLLTLLKLLLFVAAVAVLTWGGAWLMEQGGGAVVAVGGVEVTLTPLQMALGLVVLAGAVWLIIALLRALGALLRFLNGDDNALSRHFRGNRERRGLDALTDAAVALASGDGPGALARAEVAARDLDRPELTHVILAQAAELAGDLPRAEAEMKLLATHARTRFAGLRGLMRQRLAAGDDAAALALAEKAFELRPQHRETQDVLLRLQAESHDWAGARTTLGAQLRSGSLPRDVHRRRDAVLALGQAADVTAEGASVEAREAAIEANRLSPDLIPAAVMAARAYIEAGDARAATRILTKAWGAQPHPDLAAAFAEIAPHETPAERLRRFDPLIALDPQNAETRLLAAELRLSAEEFPGARRALGPLPDENHSGRALTLMAAVARGMGEDEAVVRGWLTRALAAPRGPQWVCGKCNRVHGAWAPVCANCHAFDTLAWTVPPAEGAPAGAEMPPLLIEPAPVPVPVPILADAEPARPH